MVSKIVGKPSLKPAQDDALDRFVQGAPDAASTARAAAPAAAALPADLMAGGGRKKPISLTIDPKILAQLDAVAGKLGVSRAAAFSLAVTRFIAAEGREDSR
jgi:hypothetical protein